MKQNQRPIKPALKSLFQIALLLLPVLWQAGCVDINDAKVQVQTPGLVDPYGRNVLDQCTPHVLPHRLIQGTIGAASPYFHTNGGLVTDQAGFDLWWPWISVQMDQNKVVTQNLKPVIDWAHQITYFVVVPMNNSCQRAKPIGDEMTTDCYNVTMPIYIWNEKENCQDTFTTEPIFTYIYPIINLPVNVQWIYPTPTYTFTPTPTDTSTPTRTPTPTLEPGEDE